MRLKLLAVLLILPDDGIGLLSKSSDQVGARSCPPLAPLGGRLFCRQGRTPNEIRMLMLIERRRQARASPCANGAASQSPTLAALRLTLGTRANQVLTPPMGLWPGCDVHPAYAARRRTPGSTPQRRWRSRFRMLQGRSGVDGDRHLFS